MRRASRKSLEYFLDRINNAAKSNVKEIRLPFADAIAISTAITELLADLNEKEKRVKVLNIVSTDLDGGGDF